MPEGATVERPALLALERVVKNYQGLRPLRIQALTVRQEDAIALLGFDAPMAEVLVHLITAGSLPDEGRVVLFGQPTTSITDHAAWLKMIDRLGLVSYRSPILDQLTAEQNLALPFDLAIHSLDDELRRTVRRLADEIALPASHLSQPVAALPPPSQLRVRLGRALALEPEVLLAEHPNATLTKQEAMAFASDLSRIRRDRRVASLAMTADRAFAEAAASQVLTLQPATGELASGSSWRPRWLR